MGIGGSMVIENALTTPEVFSTGQTCSHSLFFSHVMVAPILQMSNIGTQLTEAFAGLRSYGRIDEHVTRR